MLGVDRKNFCMAFSKKVDPHGTINKVATISEKTRESEQANDEKLQAIKKRPCYYFWLGAVYTKKTLLFLLDGHYCCAPKVLQMVCQLLEAYKKQQLSVNLL